MNQNFAKWEKYGESYSTQWSAVSIGLSNNVRIRLAWEMLYVFAEFIFVIFFLLVGVRLCLEKASWHANI